MLPGETGVLCIAMIERHGRTCRDQSLECRHAVGVHQALAKHMLVAVETDYDDAI